MVFGIKENLHNKYLRRVTIKTAEDLNDITLEQSGSRNAKSEDIQALNKFLFCDLIILKRVPATSTFTDLISKYY